MCGRKPWTLLRRYISRLAMMAQKMLVQIDEMEWEIASEEFDWSEYYGGKYDDGDVFPTAVSENVWLGDRLMMLRDYGWFNGELLIEESREHPSIFENQRFDLPQLGLRDLTFEEMVEAIVTSEEELRVE
jgi:hypothetical protein